MTLEKVLCQKYLEPSSSFWESANRLLKTMKAHPQAMAMIAQIQRTLLHEENAFLATEQTKDLTEYLQDFVTADTSMVVAVICGLCLPEGIEKLSQQGASSQVIEDTFQNFSVWSKDYLDTQGREGIDELPWVYFHYTGKLVRLGRLMYESSYFAFPYYLFEDNKTGELTVLCKPNLAIDEDGYFVGTNQRKKEMLFQTSLVTTDQQVTGFAANPVAGIIERKAFTLSLKQYRLLLAPGMPLISIHIPRGTPLIPQSVDASLQQAREYYQATVLNNAPFFCESWMLDPALAKIAGESSKLSHFMERFSKFPVFTQQSSIVKYLFGMNQTEESSLLLPATTSLQKNYHQYIREDKETFDTGGFLRSEK